MRRTAATILVCVAGALAACDLPSGSTSPSGSTTEIFSGTLDAGDSRLFTFTVSESGTVAVTLSATTATQPIGLAFGTPDDTGSTCTALSTAPSAVAAATPQIRTTADAGTYCVEAYDAGSLSAPATFSITVEHP